MFLLPAKTPILIYAPFGTVSKSRTPAPAHAIEGNTWFHDTVPWRGFITKADRLYDKHEIFDFVALHNHPDTVETWMHNLITRGEAIIHRYNAGGHGVFGRVRREFLQYLD